MKHYLAPKRKLATIRNGVDCRAIVAALGDGSREAFRRETGIPQSAFVIGSSGRLARQKDNASLIRSMDSLRRALPTVTVVLALAGDGPESPRLLQLARELDLEGSVVFFGFRRDIPRFLASLDVFASLSLWEGLSISLLEAMAAAKPIVTTSIQPNAELIQHERTGLLVRPQSPEDAARALARYITDSELAESCGSGAQREVLDKYTISRMFRETMELYDCVR
jgi:glycosyltransferase involved in cell wall biosynthesis